MSIELLNLSQFRNISAAQLRPVQGLNVIEGKNGGGKTSILEALYFFGLGRSFRTSQLVRLIQNGSTQFSLHAQAKAIADMPSVSIGAERHVSGATRLRLRGEESATFMDIASLLPVRLINSQSHQLLEGGPSFRRKYVDWGLFYTEKHFLPAWRQYQHIIRQRNLVLKHRGSKAELDAWTKDCVHYGLVLHQLRQAYVQQILARVEVLAYQLLGVSGLEMNYCPGWDVSREFAEALSRSDAQGQYLGFTPVGPHRADIDIYLNGLPVKHFLSRGQQKLLICAMILAQGVFLASAANMKLIYLVDDLPAELDQEARSKLMGLICEQHAQVFITAIEAELIADAISSSIDVPSKVFHVEHGQVSEKQ